MPTINDDILEPGFKALNVTNELAKLGIKLSDWSARSPKGDLLKARMELRRGLNALTDATRAAMRENDQERTDFLMGCSETCAGWVSKINDQIDMNDHAAEVWGARSSDEWQARDGHAIKMFTPRDRLADQPSERSQVDFGSVIRGMALGTRDPDVRASLSEGSDAGGGYTVPVDLLRQIIDLMRSKTTVVRAGAMTVELGTEVTKIARLASDPTAAWRLENAAVNVADPTFEAVTLTARSLAVLVKCSRELLEDSVNLTSALMNAFAQSMAVETDRVALFGSGTAPEPQGIFGATGIGSVSMGTDGAAPTSYDEYIDLLSKLAEQNAGDPTAIIIAPRTATQLAKLKDSTNQPLSKPQALAEIPFMSTTQVPTDQTQGTADNASCAIAGDFSQLILGVRNQLRIELLRERFADNLQYGFLAHLRMDIALTHPESFAVLEGIIPAA